MAAALSHAEHVLNVEHEVTTGLVQCSSCKQLAGDACQFSNWHLVTDKWRRCSDFTPLQKPEASGLNDRFFVFVGNRFVFGTCSRANKYG